MFKILTEIDGQNLSEFNQRKLADIFVEDTAEILHLQEEFAACLVHKQYRKDSTVFYFNNTE